MLEGIRKLKDLAEIEFADIVEDVFITDVNQFKRNPRSRFERITPFCKMEIKFNKSMSKDNIILRNSGLSIEFTKYVLEHSEIEGITKGVAS